MYLNPLKVSLISESFALKESLELSYVMQIAYHELLTRLDIEDYKIVIRGNYMICIPKDTLKYTHKYYFNKVQILTKLIVKSHLFITTNKSVYFESRLFLSNFERDNRSKIELWIQIVDSIIRRIFSIYRVKHLIFCLDFKINLGLKVWFLYLKTLL